MNCMNLNITFEDIVSDPTLMESSLIALSETWLQPGMQFDINGFVSHFNSMGQGKGLAFYYKHNTFRPTVDIKEENIQITKMETTELEVITVYRSDKGNVSDLLDYLKTLIKPGVATVVRGDFNICCQANKNNKVTKYLVKVG